MNICNCGREFKSQRSLNSHSRFCEFYIKKEKKTSKYKKEENLYVCECNKEFNNPQSLNAHFCYCLIHRDNKPQIDKFKGKHNWNKGLTKETDERVKNIALKVSKSSFGKIVSIDTRNKLSSLRLKYLENNPHIKWYEISNGERIVKVQGKWEYNVANWLNLQNIKWDRKMIKYDGYRRYTPDFYLIDYDEYLEVKGWLRDYDKIKMEKVIKEHNVKIKILYKKDYKKLNKINIDDLNYYGFD